MLPADAALGLFEAFDGGGHRHDLAGGHHLAVADEVLATDLQAIHAELFGQEVDGRLVGDRHLGRAEAAHGAVGVVVGVDADHVHVDVGHAVGAGGMTCGLAHDGDARRGVGALLGVDLDLGRHQVALPVSAELVVDAQRVALVARGHGLGAVVVLAHDAAGLEGRKRKVELDAQVLAAAEGAARRGLHAANLLERQAEGDRKQALLLVDPLARRVNGQDVAVHVGHPRLDVEERVIDGLGLVGVLDRDEGLGHGRLGVPAPDGLAAHHVAARMDLGRALGKRLVDGEDAGQRAVVDLDELEGAVRDLGGLGDHHGHRIAGVTNEAACDQLLVAGDQAVGVGAGNVLGGVDGDHAGQGLGLNRVDAEDLGVGVHAAQDRHVQGVGPREVPAVLGLTRHLAAGVVAADAGAHRPHGVTQHGSLPCSTWRPAPPRPRPSCSPCSGRCCPPSPCGPLRGWDPGTSRGRPWPR
ncbi:hypothetical protein D3C86_1233560 [compost metagenome]